MPMMVRLDCYLPTLTYQVVVAEAVVVRFDLAEACRTCSIVRALWFPFPNANTQVKSGSNWCSNSGTDSLTATMDVKARGFCL